MSEAPRPRVALIACNARFTHTSLALRLLRGYALAQGFQAAELVLAEYTINDRPLPLLQRLFLLQADVYAFSCYIWNIALVRQLTALLRRVQPAARIVWGGPEASQEAERVLAANPALDWIIAGEGEAAFLALLNQLFPATPPGVAAESAGSPGNPDCPGDTGPSGRTLPDPTAIPGLIWQDPLTGGIRTNRPVSLLPAADWVFPYSDIDLAGLQNRLIYLETTRGCPYRCTYCLSALDRAVRYRPLAVVFAELDRLIAAGLPQVKLVDRTFNCRPDRALAIWRYLIEAWQRQPFLTNFHFEVTADTLDEASLTLLCQAPPGLFQLEIGVQSTQPAVLAAVCRPCSLPDLERAVVTLRWHSAVHLHLDLIAGLPGETLAMFAESFDTVYRWQPQQLQLGFLKVLPGTEMQEQASRLHFAWQDEPPYEILASDQMTYADLSLLKDIEAMVDLFHNSGHFAHFLPQLVRQSSAPYHLFRRLAAAWRAGGLFERPVGREDLWAFLATFAPAQLDWLKLDYLLLGQRDTPAWLDSLETSRDPQRQVSLAAGRQRLRRDYPELRRYRLEDFAFDPADPKGSASDPKGSASDPKGSASDPKGSAWLAAFDCSGQLPRLLWRAAADNGG